MAIWGRRALALAALAASAAAGRGCEEGSSSLEIIERAQEVVSVRLCAAEADRTVGDYIGVSVDPGWSTDMEVIQNEQQAERVVAIDMEKFEGQTVYAMYFSASQGWSIKATLKLVEETSVASTTPAPTGEGQDETQDVTQDEEQRCKSSEDSSVSLVQSNGSQVTLLLCVAEGDASLSDYFALSTDNRWMPNMVDVTPNNGQLERTVDVDLDRFSPDEALYLIYVSESDNWRVKASIPLIAPRSDGPAVSRSSESDSSTKSGTDSGFAAVMIFLGVFISLSAMVASLIRRKEDLRPDAYNHKIAVDLHEV